MAITDEQSKRYARQLLLPEINKEGQERLLAASVLCVGAGGLGSAALLYLAAAGVGTIGIVDDDIVDVSNLQRQIIHRTDSIGTGKAVSARRTLSDLNPDIRIKTYEERFGSDNGTDMICGYDLVIDASDNFETKFTINDLCVRAGIPFIHAGVEEYYGQIFTCLPERTACLRCIMQEKPSEHGPGRASSGILGPTAGIIGCMQVVEAIKLITCTGGLLTDRILFIDTLHMTFDTINVSRRSDCQTCAASAEPAGGS